MSAFDDAVMDDEERRDDSAMEDDRAYWFAMFEREQQQADLPPHQRDGYCERIMEIADQRRKELKEGK